MDGGAGLVDASALVLRVEALQRERDEKQRALEVLIHRVGGLQYEMDEKVDIVDLLTCRVEELQRERDELKKDIEQLCMHQAEPHYVSVATRMLSQRTEALEQDIETLQKKLGGCLRENQNLQEELAEAYRIKSQLAELHGAELSKNKDIEKQVRFFQSSVAQAFAERDNYLMECEKAKEREEAVLRKFADVEERTREYQIAFDDQKRLNDGLHRELTELKAQTESSMKVVVKFYELRCRDCECPRNVTFEEKCSILLDDSSEKWCFSSDGGVSTLKYIASLEEEKDSLKAKIAKLQSNLRMGLEIEQHLQRNAQILEKRQALYDDFMRSGLLELRQFHENQRTEVMKMLAEESLQLSTIIAEIQEKLGKICISTEISGIPVDKLQCCDNSCKDVHVSTDTVPKTATTTKDDSPAICDTIRSDESKALAQALQEKMDVLMLFSQEQERYLLEKHRNQIVIADLQKNLSQVKNENVKVLMELAKLKDNYLLLKGSSVKQARGSGDSLKDIPGHDQHGLLKTMLKSTSFSQWMRKDSSNIGDGSSGSNNHAVCKEHSVDIARLKVENATLMESIGTVERLTCAVHRLHVVLLKAYDNIKSADPLESTYEALNSLIIEATLIKTALGVFLPLSLGGDSSDTSTYEALYNPSDSPRLNSEKLDPFSSAGMEMVELLILVAEILKASFLLKK